MAETFTSDPIGQLKGITGDAKDLAVEVQEAAGQFTEFVRAEVQEHPYRTLGAAALTGYVLGGGLASPLTTQLMRVGFRLLLIPLLQAQFQQHGPTSAKSATQH
ncbi:MAG: hypothetical protein ACYCWW_09750 [Deltaproteobacteria bacterium]